MIENIILGIMIAVIVVFLLVSVYISVDGKIVKNQIKLIKQAEAIANLQERVKTLDSLNSHLLERVHKLEGHTEEEF